MVGLAILLLSLVMGCTGFDPTGVNPGPDDPPDDPVDAALTDGPGNDPDASTLPDAAAPDAGLPVDASPVVDADPTTDGGVAPCMSNSRYDMEDPTTGHKYWKYSNAMLPIATWGEAVTICEMDGAHLAVIDSAEENDMVHDMSLVLGDMWIGLGDAATEGTYEWVTGAPLNYDNWGPGQPSEIDPAHDCVGMEGSGRWNDVGCGVFELREFVCECDPDYFP